MSTESNPFDKQPFEAEPPVSRSLQPALLHIGFVPQPPDGTQVEYAAVTQAFGDIPKLLENWEDVIAQKTSKLLLANETQKNPNLDALFAFHTDYASFCIKARLAQRPSRLWEARIAPIVEASELRLKSVDPNARIHKGPPLFNVGLCSLACGDFDNAYRFFAEAGVEDERSGRGGRFKVLLGDHALSEKVLILPLEKTLFPLWSAQYGAITGQTLDKTEFQALLAGLARRPVDAFQTVIALHRFRRTIAGIENEATQHIRVRAIAELLIVLESALERQLSPRTNMLGGLLDALLQVNPTAQNAFRTLRSDFDTRYPRAAPHSPPSTNWILGEANTRIANSRTTAEKIGNLCSLMHRLRNGVSHVLDSSLDIYSNAPLAKEIAGLVLCSLRIAKHGEDNTLAAIP